MSRSQETPKLSNPFDQDKTNLDPRSYKKDLYELRKNKMTSRSHRISAVYTQENALPSLINKISSWDPILSPRINSVEPPSIL